MLCCAGGLHANPNPGCSNRQQARGSRIIFIAVAYNQPTAPLQLAEQRPAVQEQLRPRAPGAACGLRGGRDIWGLIKPKAVGSGNCGLRRQPACAVVHSGIAASPQRAAAFAWPSAAHRRDGRGGGTRRPALRPLLRSRLSSSSSYESSACSRRASARDAASAAAAARSSSSCSC